MVNSRAKGVAGEHEARRIFEAELGVSFKRDIEQYRAGDHGDLLCEDPDFPFVIEIKRRAGGGVDPKWWDQVCSAAKSVGKYPLLVWRVDRAKWHYRMPVQCIVSLGGALAGDIAEQYDWRYATETDDQDTAFMLIREVYAGA